MVTRKRTTTARCMLVATLAAAVSTACGAGAEPGDGAPGGSGVGLGGAQDIGAFRGILEGGGIPGEATLDAGGFFSEHYSELPPADCGGTLCLVSRIAVGKSWTGGPDQAVLQVSLSTPLDPSELERRPLDLVLVVDTSGSMQAQDRIGYANQAIDQLVAEMDPGDRLALVTFSDEVRVPAGLVPVGDRTELRDLIEPLVADGATNLHDGLARGLAIAAEALDPARQTRVLLLSDGLATVGVTDGALIQEMADGYMSDGIGLTTVGVGLDFDVGLMRSLAERGAGNFYFLEEPAAITEVFREELDTQVTPIALDVSLSVAAEAGWRIGEVIGTHGWSGGERGGAISLPAVFLASRESDQPGEYGRRGAGGAIFFSMLPPAGRTVWSPSEALASLDLRYRAPGGGDQVTLGELVGAAPEPGGPLDAYLDDEAMAEHYAMYNLYLGLRQATREASWVSHDCALSTLDRLDASAARWQSRHADEDIDADRDLIARFAANLRERGAVVVGGECAAYDGDPTSYAAPMACQAGGDAGAGATGLALIGLALAAATRARRRGGAARR